jgi:hypothetical protein
MKKPGECLGNRESLLKNAFSAEIVVSGQIRYCNLVFVETFARCHERYENKAKICEKAEFTRGK